jgi:serine/threonine protein kinase
MAPDFCDGGELVDKVTTAKPMGEKMASRIFRELMEALVFLHDQGVAHMDLKPENIVFQNRWPVLLIRSSGRPGGVLQGCLGRVPRTAL